MSKRNVEVSTILCLNGGSSSLKFALYTLAGAAETLLVRGAAERIGLGGGQFWMKGAGLSETLRETRDFPHQGAAVEATFAALKGARLPIPTAIGHRLVHGGSQHAAPERVAAGLLKTLRELVPFAPLHLPGEIDAIEAVMARYPGLPQVACFDTAFHRRMPEAAQRFPLPDHLWDEGVRRYGFHGLSYEYILSALGGRSEGEGVGPVGKGGPAGRVIIAHLGNGASMAAIRNGQPMDTTMGLTPAGGLMMGTRSGDLDPGILLYLLGEKGWSAAQIETLVNHGSGLLGVSGISPDMKTLLETREREPRADLAIVLFCRAIRKQIGALSAVLGGVDTLVFTGGIGERAAPVRWESCLGLEFLGIVLDAARNAAHGDPISSPRSACTVRVIPTNEDLMIARHTRDVVAPRGA